MASENEPAKLLLPYLQRADELQKHEPLVAYYCRLYAMERGLRIPQNERTKTTNSLLISLMKQLEKDKKSLELGPEDNLHVEGFASSVFAKADKQDRAGRADLNTAKTFYAASIFFEILNQFGILLPDLEQKQKYAAWKAADIRKALKEGRKPIPGPPGGGDDLSIPSSTPSGSLDLGPSKPAVTSPRNEFDLSSQFHDKVDDHPPINYSSSAEFRDGDSNQNSVGIPPATQFDKIENQHSAGNHPSLSSYPSASYPSHDIHAPASTNRSDNPVYSEQYHPSYAQEPQQHLPHNYPSHEPLPPHSYPNFQSYPSFTESSLPSTTTHYPTYYQGSEASYTPPQAAPSTNYPSSPQYISGGRKGTISEYAPPPAQSQIQTQMYQYDSTYQPPPEKIAEAHKAARFAVGALAFDDVSIAVDYLRKSLELLTNPSSGQ